MAHPQPTQVRVIGRLLDLAAAAKATIERAFRARRLDRLRALGMHIGRDVLLPADTYIDVDYCHLISIGDSCGLGPECMLLAHDPTAAAPLGAVRVGRVTLHPSCHIGARTVVLPGIEMGPRTVVAANSVVSASLPPDTVCAGNPARPIKALAPYLDAQEERMETSPTFEYGAYSLEHLTPERREELVRAAKAGDAYLVGGRSAELRERGGTERTPFGDYTPAPPRRSRAAHGPDDGSPR